ncbi:IS5 family transposase [Gemmobacter nectariphilus]|uniref:IS5 family transposase n=1 Tax=Gemmobacter nectariphilus TaxID=220343 RepID=UPI000414EC96|nr:IS5 family transposase [Gemmobacter nectariphilus]
MKHRPRPEEQDDLLRRRLVDLIDMRPELVKLAELIDWEFFETEWAGFFPSSKGRPATSPRLVAGHMYLQHAYRLSDEAVIASWVDSPYFQHFIGETFFQHRPPIDPSSLVRWRKRIGEDGVEWLLTKTIEAGRKSGAVNDGSLSRVAVDTTVMEKNIAHPTDARLYEKARRRLVALAVEAWIELRQTYNRLAPPLAAHVGRYAHARQFRRMRKTLGKLKGYMGRVMRDLRRHLDEIPEGALRARVLDALALVSRLLHQGPKSRGKIYALHEPEVDCISKGKARVRYEFGTKVSLATTIDEGFVVGTRAFPGNPYDGHTLAEALEQVEVLTEQKPSLAVVDRGCRGQSRGSFGKFCGAATCDTIRQLRAGRPAFHRGGPAGRVDADATNGLMLSCWIVSSKLCVELQGVQKFGKARSGNITPDRDRAMIAVGPAVLSPSSFVGKRISARGTRPDPSAKVSERLCQEVHGPAKSECCAGSVQAKSCPRNQFYTTFSRRYEPPSGAAFCVLPHGSTIGQQTGQNYVQDQGDSRPAGSETRENCNGARSIGTEADLQLGQRLRRDLVPHRIEQSV